jgi:hypothetical protein
MLQLRDERIVSLLRSSYLEKIDCKSFVIKGNREIGCLVSGDNDFSFNVI